MITKDTTGVLSDASESVVAAVGVATSGVVAPRPSAPIVAASGVVAPRASAPIVAASFATASVVAARRSTRIGRFGLSLVQSNIS